ncbi:MAG: hypothetical protein HFF31_02995 [Flavonifractor sp.]|nr:hypothetical protein [Flavonifractor sp.]
MAAIYVPSFARWRARISLHANCVSNIFSRVGSPATWLGLQPWLTVM